MSIILVYSAGFMLLNVAAACCVIITYV